MICGYSPWNIFQREFSKPELTDSAVSDPSPHYFTIIVEALTRKSVPIELSDRVKQSAIILIEAKQ
ncbi:MAG: hypothetical protein AB9828_07995 [Sphaerochaetaceae bacterium]